MKKILLVVDCFNGGAGNMAQILFINFSAKYDVDLSDFLPTPIISVFKQRVADIRHEGENIK